MGGRTLTPKIRVPPFTPKKFLEGLYFKMFFFLKGKKRI
jgi:hypothetical protein